VLLFAFTPLILLRYLIYWCGWGHEIESDLHWLATGRLARIYKDPANSRNPGVPSNQLNAIKLRADTPVCPYQMPRM